MICAYLVQILSQTLHRELPLEGLVHNTVSVPQLAFPLPVTPSVHRPSTGSDVTYFPHILVKTTNMRIRIKTLFSSHISDTPMDMLERRAGAALHKSEIRACRRVGRPVCNEGLTYNYDHNRKFDSGDYSPTGRLQKPRLFADRSAELADPSATK